MKIDDFKILNSNILGERTGLSPKNSGYSDIITIQTKFGKIYMSKHKKVIILSRQADLIIQRLGIKNNDVIKSEILRDLNYNK